MYTSIGLLSLVFQGNYLDYGVLPLPLKTAQVHAMGILGIEIGVVMGVTGVFVLIFDALTAWGEEE
jgi:multicomponent Na+:H+ antiporter subunit B